MKAIVKGMLTMLCCLTSLAASAQDIKQLEEAMYRFYSSSETDSFTYVTERLKEACLNAGPGQERLFYKAWANQAIYYFIRVSRSRGLEVARQVQDYAHQHNSKFGLYTSTYATATMQTNLRRYEQAERGFREAIDYQHQYFPDESAAAPYLGLAKIFVNTHRQDKVLECAHKALSEPGIIKQHELTSWSYICIALFEGDTPEKKEEFNRAYAEREKVKAAYGHDDSFGDMVGIYHARVNGNPMEALEIAKKMRAPSDQMNMLSGVYAQLGDYENAYKWYRRYKQYSDSVNSAEVQQLSYEYATQLDVSRAENEAKTLRLSNQTVEIRAGIAIALVTLSFLCFYFFRRRKQLQALRLAYDQLEDTTTAKERIDSELRIARDIQLGMVPTTFPAFPDRDDIDLYASMLPAKAVGGDLYDFFLNDDHLYFCVGDVSGKGVPASMTMAVAVNLFRTIAKDLVKPETVAMKINETLSRDNESGIFVTMFLGVIDLKTGRLDFCNCGHNPPIMGQHRSQTSQTVFHYLEMEANAPLGLWPELEFVGESVEDVRDCPLFIYTDGISEAENRDQAQFGERRMLRVLNESSQPFGERVPKSRSRYLVERMKTAVEQYVGDAEQSDDLTMLCLHIK